MGSKQIMVVIKPFKGIIYNKDKINSLDDVMSPPYDIISEKMQDELYKKSQNNFVRLILGKQFENDTDKNNRYTRAKKEYHEWLEKSVLTLMDNPSLFPYQISYDIEGKQKKMNGFFTLLQLDKKYTLVKAHERTLSKPKADRLDLMRATHSNLEPIQLLYIDPENTLQKLIKNYISKNPLISVKGYDDFTHELWNISDEQTISKITDFLSNKILFIADGHHRYQTAINYAEEQMKETKITSEDAAFNYQMVILVNMYDKGLEILPTHRLLHLPDNIDVTKVISEMEKYFSITKTPIDSSSHTNEIVQEIKIKIKKPNSQSFAWCFKETYYTFILKDHTIMNTLASDRSDTWKNLDVSILHKILIEHGLGINQDTLEDHVKYTRDDNEAIDLLKQGNFNSSIIMNATKIDELKAIADGGEHMPQKSTYFIPKMLSGLVMYHMDQQ